ncbi:hypothetical protein [Burkholderia diffusa]|uniref:hypothetical protein n=1 Tax=Burkholderia diffusa TaxID=488732 RepID=UPI0012D9F104|nr:hypothetical protein [Burkholderia diffusa]
MKLQGNRSIPSTQAWIAMNSPKPNHVPTSRVAATTTTSPDCAPRILPIGAGATRVTAPWALPRRMAFGLAAPDR